LIHLASETEALIDRAIAEDLNAGDPTTEALVPPDLQGRAVVVAKEEGVLAGGEVAVAVVRRVGPTVEARSLMPDGSPLKPADVIVELEGPLASILTAERTALNFLQHLSGIATETSRYVREVAGCGTRILDTRKTTPGFRELEKYAVRVGGGGGYRLNLGDGILVKDNHIEAMRLHGLSLGDVVRKARSAAGRSLKVEVEVEDLGQVREALDAGAELLLLDNMGLEEMAEAVEMARGRALTEASGGVTLQNVRAVAATGVDFISVGALTHSAKALDVSMELV
jgi:nicotinate-nucleotide pyrophosphorylase (carboxylating)